MTKLNILLAMFFSLAFVLYCLARGSFLVFLMSPQEHRAAVTDPYRVHHPALCPTGRLVEAHGMPYKTSMLKQHFRAPRSVFSSEVVIFLDTRERVFRSASHESTPGGCLSGEFPCVSEQPHFLHDLLREEFAIPALLHCVPASWRTALQISRTPPASRTRSRGPLRFPHSPPNCLIRSSIFSVGAILGSSLAARRSADTASAFRPRRAYVMPK